MKREPVCSEPRKGREPAKHYPNPRSRVGKVREELPELPADSERLAMGRTREGARFTAPPPAGELPADYGETLTQLKQLIRQARIKAVLAANQTMIMAYWQMGQTILQRQASAGWGAKVIDRLSADLRREFPDMQGLSPRNLKYMRTFATA